MTKKSITLFIQSLNLTGGKTVMLFQMADLLIEAGFDVTICSFWQPRPLWWLRFRTTYPLPKGARFTYIFKPTKEDKKPFNPIHAEKNNSPEKLERFCAYCKTVQTDAIYMPNFGQFIETAVLENVPKRVFKILGDHHGPRYKFIDLMEEPFELSNNYKKFYAWAKDFDAIHLVNPIIDDRVKQFFFNDIISIPNFIDAQPVPTAGFLESRTIVTGGRLVAEKRFSDLLEAFHGCLSKFPDWKLEIYGRGKEKKALDKIIAERSMQNSASIIPPTNKFKARLSKAALHVSSSESESFGLTLAEAMSFGVPVLSQFHHAGFKYLLSDDRGQLAMTPDVQGIQELMSKNMQIVEAGDPDGMLQRKAADAYEFSKTVFYDRSLSAWRDALNQGIAAKRSDQN